MEPARELSQQVIRRGSNSYARSGVGHSTTILHFCSTLSEPQQSRGVASQDRCFINIRNAQAANTFQHQTRTTNLMRIVAAGENLTDARESDRQFDRFGIEIDGVEVEVLQVFARRSLDIHAA